MNNLLIVSTAVCGISKIIPIIVKCVIAWILCDNEIEKNLRLELKKLEDEMLKISMVNEFSRYTKIQRKHIKLKEEYKNISTTRMSSRMKTQLFFTYAANFISGIIIILMVKMYGSQPIIVFPKGTLWPLNYILSFPGDHQDSISLIAWVGISSLVLPHLLSIKNFL